jgi:transposase InsO family protein
MLLHGNARLSPFQRQLVCERVRLESWTIEEAAEAAGCSHRTVYRWLKRYDAGEPMTDRSSAPKRRPTRTPARVEREIERLRRLRWTSTRIAATLKMAVSTVCAVLVRLGLNRRWKLGPPEPPNRYCRRHAGELVHLDVKKLGRFRRPGHRMRGRGPGRRTFRAGWEAVHVCVDDATRLAYVEVLPDEKALTTIEFVERAIAWFAQRGIRVRQLMSDNGAAYTSAPFATWCAQHRVDHIRTRPYRPRTNGKAERFIQTMLREWATAPAIPAQRTEPEHSPPGSTTTTTNVHTAPSVTSHPPAAFTTTDQRHWNPHLDP